MFVKFFLLTNNMSFGILNYLIYSKHYMRLGAMRALSFKVLQFMSDQDLGTVDEFARKTGDRVSSRTIRRIIDEERYMPQIKTWVVLSRIMKDEEVMEIRRRLLRQRARRRMESDDKVRKKAS